MKTELPVLTPLDFGHGSIGRIGIKDVDSLKINQSMKEQNFTDFLPVSHIEALQLLADGLCRIREAAIDSPVHAMQVADVLHNIPGIMAGKDRAGEAYLADLLKKGRVLVDDKDWKKY